MNPLEIAAFVLGIANIVLLVRRSIWNFPFGIAMVALYAVIFFENRLYGEAGLQGFFLLVQAYGWMLWARAGGRETPVAVRWMSTGARLAVVAAILVGAAALGTLMHRHTDAALPFADAFVTSTSIAAQILLSLRRIENWALWIVVDTVAIVLYLIRGLELTAVLYAAFLVLSGLGLREWMKAGQKRESPQ